MEFLKRFALCISGLLLAIGLSAQEPSENITVKGEVLTVKSDAVIGAGVMLKGTTQGDDQKLADIADQSADHEGLQEHPKGIHTLLLSMQAA